MKVTFASLAVIILFAGLLRGTAPQDQSAAPSPAPAASPSPSESAPPPRVAEPKKVRISTGVAETLKTHDVRPEYPEEAKKKHIQGDVVLQYTIDLEGRVVNPKVVHGDPILAEAALKAVKQWKYRPFLLNGKPVEAETTMVVKFHM